MAITTNPADFAAPAFKVGAKAKAVAFYIFIGLVAMGVAIPAALATAGQPF